MQTEIVHIMDYTELDKIVNRTFPGLGFEFVEKEEMENDSYMYFGTIIDPPFYTWEREDLAEFLSDPLKCPYFTTSTVLLALVSKGILGPGNYLIQVSW